MKSFIVLACLVVYANAHACLVFPPQRGEIPVTMFTKAGDSACLRVQPPCDGFPTDGKSYIEFMAGQNATAVILKNLDHFYSSNPGSWEVFLWAKGASSGKSILRFADTSDFKTLEWKAVSMMISADTEKGPAILQLIYTTNNPNAPAMFYQCADVVVM